MNFEQKLDEALFEMIDAQIERATQAYISDPSEPNLLQWYELYIRSGQGNPVIDTLNAIEYSTDISENFVLNGDFEWVGDTKVTSFGPNDPDSRFGEMELQNEHVSMDRHPYGKKLPKNQGTIVLDLEYHWPHPNIKIDSSSFARLMQYRIQTLGPITMKFEQRAMHAANDEFNTFIADVYEEEFVWATFDLAITAASAGDPIIVEYTTVLHDSGVSSDSALPSGGRINRETDDVSYRPVTPEPPNGP